MRIFLELAGVAAMAAAPPSADPQTDATNKLNCAVRLTAAGEYLKAADFLTSAAKDEADTFGALHQFASQMVPFVTGGADEPRAIAAGADKADLAKLSRAQLHEAIAEIVTRASRTNIVILNEEHQAPRDRAFALQVAQALRPLGYSVLAAEAFSSSADPVERERKARSLLERGYPLLDTGLYVRDPVFADFVRQSLALGYKPVVYEYAAPKGSPPPADPIAAREQGEADNLVQQIFSKEPSAKVLIYVGYSHAAEVPLSGNVWMAARLKEATGIDPLTIDQTTLSPSAVDKEARALYAGLMNRLDRRSVVPIIGGKPVTVGALGPAVDLQVAHPPAQHIRGRPDWRFASGRSAIEVPTNLLPRRGRVLVQAFKAGDAPDAVPLDQVVVTAGQKPPPLVVPHVPLRFAVRGGYIPGDCDVETK